MAITVSDEFKAIWQEKQGKVEHMRLRYKRRYKLGTTYYSESDWRVLERNEFSAVGQIPQQLDVRRNVIKTSVLTLKMPNENNQWIEHAGSPSFWAADSVATNGYKATRTLWQVQQGYELASGSIEWISVFTGIQMKLPKITGKGEYALIEVSSKAVLLEKADAEEVRDTDVTLENCIPATGDGSNTEFESTSTGVDHTTDFQVAGSSKTQGSQYRVSNENEIASAGNTGRLLITTSAAPAAGQTVKVSLTRWLKDKTLEYLEGLLCDEAGIPSSERSIAPAIFPGGLSGSKTITTQANWEAGTVLTNISTLLSPGDIVKKWFTIDDFSDNEFSSNPAWTLTSKTGAPTASAASGAFVLTAATGESITYETPFSKTTGTWEFTYTAANVANGSSYFYFAAQQLVGTLGYALVFNRSGGGRVLLTTYGGADILDCGAVPAGAHTWRITRNSSGLITVYLDGVSVGSATDTQLIIANRMYFIAAADGGGPTDAATATIDNIRYSEEVTTDASSAATTVFESAIQDILSTPTAWGALEYVENLNGGTVTYATASSTDGISFDPYVNISGGIIQSALKRYFKIRVTIVPATGSLTSPVVSSLIANFTVNTVNVSLANHRGKNVLQQIEEYVKLADYELKFSGDGTLVIGPKFSGSFVVHLTQENGIIDVTDVDYGVPDRVIRAGRVRYQKFMSIYSDTEAGASAETIADGDELGKAVVDEDLSGILVANDVNIGVSRARVLYENNRRSATDPRPPVRIRLRIWDVPWLEVGDVIRVDFYDHPLLASLQANDELLRADSPYFHMGDPGNMISKAKDWRVIYYNPNKDTGQAEILAEEVLS